MRASFGVVLGPESHWELVSLPLPHTARSWWEGLLGSPSCSSSPQIILVSQEGQSSAH